MCVHVYIYTQQKLVLVREIIRLSVNESIKGIDFLGYSRSFIDMVEKRLLIIDSDNSIDTPLQVIQDILYRSIILQHMRLHLITNIYLSA